MDPSRHRRGGSAPSGRRPPPPPSTGEEATFLEVRRSSGSLVSVQLLDGQVLVGRITYHDRDLIKLERADGPHVMLRKSDIRTIGDQR